MQPFPGSGIRWSRWGFWGTKKFPLGPTYGFGEKTLPLGILASPGSKNGQPGTKKILCLLRFGDWVPPFNRLAWFPMRMSPKTMIFRHPGSLNERSIGKKHGTLPNFR